MLKCRWPMTPTMDECTRWPPPSRSWPSDVVPNIVHILSNTKDAGATHSWSDEDVIYFMYTRFRNLRHEDLSRHRDAICLLVLYALGGVFIKEKNKMPAIMPNVAPGKVTVHPAFIAAPARHPTILRIVKGVVEEGEDPSEVIRNMGGDAIVVLDA